MRGCSLLAARLSGTGLDPAPDRYSILQSVARMNVQVAPRGKLEPVSNQPAAPGYTAFEIIAKAMTSDVVPQGIAIFSKDCKPSCVFGRIPSNSPETRCKTE